MRSCWNARPGGRPSLKTKNLAAASIILCGDVSNVLGQHACAHAFQAKAHVGSTVRPLTRSGSSGHIKLVAPSVIWPPRLEKEKFKAGSSSTKLVRAL